MPGGGLDILGLANSFGPYGLIIGYLMWRETRQEKLAEHRIAADKAMAEADKAMAAALAELTATIRLTIGSN